MRWHILRSLLWKEVCRQRSNRGGLALAALLVVAALLLTLAGRGESNGFTVGLDICFIDYWRDDGWVNHLRHHVPEDLQRSIRFRNVNNVVATGDRLVYPPSSGAIQMRLVQGPDGHLRRRICVWEPRPGSLATEESWFWRESTFYFQQQAAGVHTHLSSDPDFHAPIEQERAVLEGGLDMRSSITSGLVLFAIFFSCVYLMPSLMCEERERGLLVAQVLSPASPLEILAGKFLFYPILGIGLAGCLAGIVQTDVLREPLFWLVLIVTAVGSLGVGLFVAGLARSQRAASMGALCYMLAVALILFICQQGKITAVSYFALEYHSPRLLHACLTHGIHGDHWIHLAAATALAGAWAILAIVVFRKRGWQT
jgi:hypothetical protein